MSKLSQEQTRESPGSASRRKVLRAIATTGGVTLAGVVLPGKWSRPIIDTLVLPAHAQTSIGPSATAIEAVAVRASSELRRVKEGPGVFRESLSQLRVQGCADGDGTITMSAVAHMDPSGTVDLGSAMTTTVAGSNFQVILNVPAAIAAQVGLIDFVRITMVIDSITYKFSVTDTELSSHLTTASTHVCTL